MSEIKSTIYSVLFGMAVIIMLVIIAAVTYLKFDYSQSYLSLIIQSIYMISSFVSGFVAARIVGKNGIVSGILPAIFISLFCLAMTFLFGGIKITKMLVITVVLILGFGSLGGVISLNVGKNKGV